MSSWGLSIQKCGTRDSEIENSKEFEEPEPII